MAGGGGGRDLPSTPTWAVALVCTIIVLLSVAMEHGLHKLGHVCSFSNMLLFDRLAYVRVCMPRQLSS